MIPLHPNTPVLTAYEQARSVGCVLATDGKRIAILPSLLPGWRRVAINIKPQRVAA